MQLRRCYSGPGVGSDGNVSKDVLWCNACGEKQERCNDYCSAKSVCGTGEEHRDGGVNCSGVPALHIDYRCGLRVQAYTNWLPATMNSESTPIPSGGTMTNMVVDPDGYWRDYSPSSKGWAACEGICPPSTPPPATPPAPPSVPCQDIVVTLWNPGGTWEHLQAELEHGLQGVTSSSTPPCLPPSPPPTGGA